MNKKYFLFTLAFFISALSFAQQVYAPDNDSDFIFTKVEREAEFPGGLKGFRIFLEKTLNSDVPVNHRARAGTYTVIVKFIVGKDGSVRDVTAETVMGYGMEEEVVRVIRLSPKWIPAMQNGAPVNAIHRQPVTFVVSK